MELGKKAYLPYHRGYGPGPFTVLRKEENFYVLQTPEGEEIKIVSTLVSETENPDLGLDDPDPRDEESIYP